MPNLDRFNDLQKQGFMRSVYAQPKKQRAPTNIKPIVSCIGCQDWHPAGKHSADKATRTLREREHARFQREYQISKAALGLI
jgi:hypothetical protein